MNNNINFETYLFLSPKKLMIAVYDKKSSKKIYYKQILNLEATHELNLNFLNSFLEKNIYEIEKYLKNFIEKIYLIIESNNFLTINISIKKNNYGDVITTDKLTHTLNETMNECKKTIDNKKIVHMVIDNYLLDKKKYFIFPKDLKCDYFSLDVRLICLSNEYIKDIEKILRKYQISINGIFYSNYVKSFLKQNQEDLFKMTMEITKGYNENEVLIVPKQSKNKGFFERFFNFFN